nr:hypothetical protein [Legionella pneumophila]
MNKKTGLSWGLFTAVGIDLLIDGILIGVAFLAGERDWVSADFIVRRAGRIATSRPFNNKDKF